MQYQDHPLRLATDRKPTEGTTHGTIERFEDGIARIARQLLFSITHLSPGDRQFLFDLTRSESRYPMRAIQRLMDISQQSTQVEHREALPEFIRHRILSREPSMGLAAAFDFETEANGRANVEQRRVERRPKCPAARAAAIEALTTQAVATRHCIVAVACLVGERL